MSGLSHLQNFEGLKLGSKKKHEMCKLTGSTIHTLWRHEVKAPEAQRRLKAHPHFFIADWLFVRPSTFLEQVLERKSFPFPDPCSIILSFQGPWFSRSVMRGSTTATKQTAFSSPRLKKKREEKRKEGEKVISLFFGSRKQESCVHACTIELHGSLKRFAFSKFVV